MRLAVEAPFEFRIGDDNPAFGRQLRSRFIQRQTAIAQLVGGFRTDDFDHPREGNILVVSRFFLRGRSEDRLF